MNNAMDNILSIEMGQMVIDGEHPSNCIMILTKRAKYCFRLSESFPIETQISIFRQFVSDIQTPEETPKVEEAPAKEPTWEPGGGEDVEKPEPVEKHDGKTLFDVPPSAPTDVEITVKPDTSTQE